MEERKSKRLPVEIGCWLVTLDEASCLHTLEVSETGASVLTDDPLAVGRVVHLKFFTPTSADGVTVEAEVVWSRLEPQGGMGLRFLNMHGTKQNVIRQWVRLAHQGEKP